MLTKEVSVDKFVMVRISTTVQPMFTFLSVTFPPSRPPLTFTLDKDLLFRPLNYLTHTHLHQGEQCVSLIAVGKVTLSKLSAAVGVDV